MNNDQSCEEYKVVVIGGGGVGKSAVVLRFVTDEFLEEYDATIEDTYRKNIQLGDQTILLDIMDTAGQEEFKSMMDGWIRDAEGFLLVYDLSQKVSFEELSSRIITKIQKIKGSLEEVPCMLIGNKNDLPPEKRQVEVAEGEQLASEKLFCPFLETSAKTSNNVNLAFERLAKIIKDTRKPKKRKARKKFCTLL